MQVAAIQMNSGLDVASNLAVAASLLENAAAVGARLAVLPENFALMASRSGLLSGAAEQLGKGPIQKFLSQQAMHNQMWIVAGTIALVSASVDHSFAACLVYNEFGERVAHYNKIHLFDVTVNDQESYNESEYINAGSGNEDNIIVIDSPIGKIGLAVCYDLRFPELFRRLLDKGATTFIIPSAFSSTTGNAHWLPLLQCRAIENLCYIIAPDQDGLHASSRATHGHSMIVSPWGDVMATLEHGKGVITADLDLQCQQKLRQRFPALKHRRL